MSEDVDVDSPEARLQMICIVLEAIVAGRASPVALAKAGLDFAHLTERERAEMRGEHADRVQTHSTPRPDYRDSAAYGDLARNAATNVLTADDRTALMAHLGTGKLAYGRLLLMAAYAGASGHALAKVALALRGDPLPQAPDAEIDADIRVLDALSAISGAGPAIVETDSTTPPPCSAAAADSTGGDR